jgi:hypothetical protein
MWWLWIVESDSFEGFEDQVVQEFEQQSFVEGKSSLMHARLYYITCIKFIVFTFPDCINLTGTY